jgi:hypothetical protein
MSTLFLYGLVYKKLVSGIVRVYVGSDPNETIRAVFDDWGEIIQQV